MVAKVSANRQRQIEREERRRQNPRRRKMLPMDRTELVMLFKQEKLLRGQLKSVQRTLVRRSRQVRIPHLHCQHPTFALEEPYCPGGDVKCSLCGDFIERPDDME